MDASQRRSDALDISDVFLEFLDCCTHQLLYVRRVYPMNLFELRSKYGISTYKCRHPDVINYITLFLSELRKLVQGELVSAVLFVVRDEKTDQLLEINTFSCSTLSKLKSLPQPTSASLSLLEEEFRSALLKLGISDSRFKSRSEGCSWELIVETNDEVNNSSSHSELDRALKSGKWYSEIDPKLPKNQQGVQQTVAEPSNDSSVDIGPATSKKRAILPIKSFRHELFDVSIFCKVFD